MFNPLSAGSGQRFELREAFVWWLRDVGSNPFMERKQGICLPQIHMSRTWSCKTKGTQGKKSMSVYHCDYFFSWITWQIQSISVTYQAETVFSSKVSVYWINCCINYFWWHDADGIIVFVGINIFNIIELILLKLKKKKTAFCHSCQMQQWQQSQLKPKWRWSTTCLFVEQELNNYLTLKRNIRVTRGLW